MPGDTIATAYVSIRPELDGFREELRSGLESSPDTKTIRINADDLEAKAKLDEVQARVDELSTKAATVKIGVTGGSRQTITDIQDALDQVRSETIVPHVDDSRLEQLNSELDALDARLGNVDRDAGNASRSLGAGGGAGGGGLLAVAGALSPALLEVGVVGAAGLAGISVAAGAAALGLGVFALAAKNDLTAAKTQIEGVYNQWTATTGAFTQPVIHDAVGLLPSVFRLLTPEVATASQALQGLEGNIAASLGSPYLHNFSTFIAGEGGTAITSFGHLVGGLGHLLSGFAEGFAPEIARIDGDMVRWGQDMTKLGNDAANGGLTRFLAYLEQNGPLVAHTLEQFGSDFVTLAKASAPLGPIWLNIADVAAELLGDLLKLDPTLTTWALGIGSVAFAAERLLGPLGGIGGVAKTLPGLISGIGDAAGVGATGIVSVAAASDGAAGAIGGLLTAGALAVPGLDLLAASVLNTTGVFSNFGDGVSKSGQQFARAFVDQLPAGTDRIAGLKAEITDLYGTIGLTGVAFRDVNGELIDYSTHTASGAEASKASAAATAEVTDKAQALEALYPGLVKATDAQKEATDAANAALGSAAGYTGSAALQYGQLTSQLQAANQALTQTDTLLNTLLGAELSVEQATTGFYSAVQSLTQSLTQNGTSLDVTTQKGLANRQAFDQVAAAIENTVKSMEHQDATSPQIVAKVQQLTGVVEAQAAKYGLTKGQVDAYLKSLGLTPKQVQTDLKLAGYDTASAQVSDIRSKLDSLNGKTVSSTVQINEILSSSIPSHPGKGTAVGFASGTHAAAGGLAWVGEHGPEAMTAGGRTTVVGRSGPEIVNVPAGAQIMTASQTARLPGYANGTGVTPVVIQAPPISITLTGSTGTDGAAFAARVQQIVDSRFAAFESEIDAILGMVPA